MPRPMQTATLGRTSPAHFATPEASVRIYRGPSRMTMVGRIDELISTLDRLIAQEYRNKPRTAA